MERKYSKKATRNKRTVYFYEDTHEYIGCGGEKYISVTTLIKKFFPEFNEKAKALEISERSGDPVDLILSYWEHTRVKACEHGTNVHF